MQKQLRSMKFPLYQLRKDTYVKNSCRFKRKHVSNTHLSFTTKQLLVWVEDKG